MTSARTSFSGLEAGRIGTTPVRRAAAGAHPSSGSAAKSRFALRYHPIPERGFFHLPCISVKASLCVSSPPATISFRWLSWALMTSFAVSPRCGKPHGPPNCAQVIVFIGLASFPRSPRVRSAAPPVDETRDRDTLGFHAAKASEEVPPALLRSCWAARTRTVESRATQHGPRAIAQAPSGRLVRRLPRGSTEPR